MVVENPAKLIVQTSVSDDTYAHLTKGGSATVEIAGDSLQGKIVRLVSAADPMSHTHLVKVEVPGINSYNSGTFARVRFTTGSRKGIAPPKRHCLSEPASQEYSSSMQVVLRAIGWSDLAGSWMGWLKLQRASTPAKPS